MTKTPHLYSYKHATQRAHADLGDGGLLGPSRRELLERGGPHKRAGHGHPNFEVSEIVVTQRGL